MCRVCPSYALLGYRTLDRQVFLFPRMLVGFSSQSQWIWRPVLEFSQPTKQARFHAEPGFLVNLGMRLVWIGRRNGWAYRNAGLYIPVSSFKSHRTTNRDFRLGAQRENLTLFQERRGTFFQRLKSKQNRHSLQLELLCKHADKYHQRYFQAFK